MTTQIPPERPLPHKQLVLDRILTDAAPVRRRTWVVPVAAAASVAVVAGGLLAANLADSNTPQPGPAPAAGPTATGRVGTPRPATAASVQVNLGPLSAAEKTGMVSACMTEASQAGAQAKAGTVTHAIRVKGWSAARPTELTVAVLDTNSGLVISCVGRPGGHTRSGQPTTGVAAGVVGGDAAEAAKGKMVINPTDATHPAAPTDQLAGWYFIDLDRSPDLLVRDSWYRTDDRVSALRQRYVVKGRPGPWYVARAVDGLVFLRSWDRSTALRKGDVVRVETQVLGHRNELLDAPADQKGGGGLTESPGPTRVDTGRVTVGPDGVGTLTFDH